MPEERTNLLPLSRQRALIREYRLKLGVVSLLFTSALVIIAITFLIPIHVFLALDAAAKKMALAEISSVIPASDEAQLSARLLALSNGVAVLTALSENPSASELLRAVLHIPRPGIALSGFVYAPVKNAHQRTIEISGSAATREALREYQLALQNAPSVVSAELPVSAYAKDADIEFTITVTIAL